MTEETPNEETHQPVMEEQEERDAPRREKSAEFEVDGGDPTQFRDALDPANQSLADALKLSYRVLQLAILALAVIFIFSGFQTVRENSTGLRTLFGRIVGEVGDQQVGPGLQVFWPYPVGEIVTVPLKRTVEVNNAFFPMLRAQGGAEQSIDKAIENASVDRPIRPGGDGSLILRGGDLAHCRVSADYTIEDSVAYLERFTPEQADEVVRMAIERASPVAATQLGPSSTTATPPIGGASRQTPPSSTPASGSRISPPIAFAARGGKSVRACSSRGSGQDRGRGRPARGATTSTTRPIRARRHRGLIAGTRTRSPRRSRGAIDHGQIGAVRSRGHRRGGGDDLTGRGPTSR